MDKITAILTKTIYYQKFVKAKTYGKLPIELSNRFVDKKWWVDKKSDVIKSPKYSEWYIFDHAPKQIELYRISFDKFVGNDVYLEIERKTPTHSGIDIHRYPMYHVGISLKNDSNLFVSGEEREELERKGPSAHRRLQKWDYFFRPSEDALTFAHREIIGDLLELDKELKNQLTTSGIKVAAFLVSAIVLLNLIWPWLAILVIGYAGYRFYSIFLDLYYAYNSSEKIKKALDVIESEKNQLLQQLIHPKVSASTIQKWLEEEIVELDAKAAESVGLNSGTIIRPADNLVANPDFSQVFGLRIIEWGFTQPVSAAGKKQIANGKYWYHLRAMRNTNQGMLLGVYYFNFIYLTKDSINLCGYFYDFLMERDFGAYTEQIYYKDIVNIRTQEESVAIFYDDTEEYQIKKIIIGSKSGASLIIPLTDRVTIETIGEKIKKRAELQQKSQEIDAVHAENLIDIDVNHLPLTSANKVLTSLRTFWDNKKSVDYLSIRDFRSDLPPTNNDLSGLLP